MNSPQRNTFPLMGLAAIMIANSHLEQLYPKRWMAADGLLGNTLFFILAGYGIILSQRQRPVNFGKFYWRRFMRIYPSFWVALALAAASGLITSLTAAPLTWLQTCLWPTGLSFIGNIMIFYPVLWAMARLSARAYTLCLGILSLLWLSIWIHLITISSHQNLSLGQLPDSLWWSFFALATAAGGLLAIRPSPPTRRTLWLLTAALFMLYLGTKFENALRLITSTEQISSVCFGGILQLLAMFTGLGLMLNLDSLNAVLTKLHAHAPLRWIGQMSLQIYVVHATVFHWVHLTTLAWPIQLGIFFLGSLVLSRGVLWLVTRQTSQTGQLSRG